MERMILQYIISIIKIAIGEKMKTTLLTLTLLFISFNLHASACIKFPVDKLVGSEYVLGSSENNPYPTYLSFYEADEANLGSAVDGNPMGTYSYESSCEYTVLVKFHSALTDKIEVLYSLYESGSLLIDKYNNKVIFTKSH
jgi:hypothetical protein